MKWLSDKHENQMLHLLQNKLTHWNPECSTNITDTYFFQILSQLHQDSTYNVDRGAAWVWRKSEEFATGVYNVLVTIVNLNNNHWVPIVVDFEASKILYSDSMGGATLMKMLKRFLHGGHITIQVSYSQKPIFQSHVSEMVFHADSWHGMHLLLTFCPTFIHLSTLRTSLKNSWRCSFEL